MIQSNSRWKTGAEHQSKSEHQDPSGSHCVVPALSWKKQILDKQLSAPAYWATEAHPVLHSIYRDRYTKTERDMAITMAVPVGRQGNFRLQTRTC